MVLHLFPQEAPLNTKVGVMLLLFPLTYVLY